MRWQGRDAPATPPQPCAACHSVRRASQASLALGPLPVGQCQRLLPSRQLASTHPAGRPAPAADGGRPAACGALWRQRAGVRAERGLQRGKLRLGCAEQALGSARAGRPRRACACVFGGSQRHACRRSLPASVVRPGPAALQVWPLVRSTLDARVVGAASTPHVFVAGWSLGASVAQLLALAAQQHLNASMGRAVSSQGARTRPHGAAPAPTRPCARRPTQHARAAPSCRPRRPIQPVPSTRPARRRPPWTPSCLPPPAWATRALRGGTTPASTRAASCSPTTRCPRPSARPPCPPAAASCRARWARR